MASRGRRRSVKTLAARVQLVHVNGVVISLLAVGHGGRVERFHGSGVSRTSVVEQGGAAMAGPDEEPEGRGAEKTS